MEVFEADHEESVCVSNKCSERAPITIHVARFWQILSDIKVQESPDSQIFF